MGTEGTIHQTLGRLAIAEQPVAQLDEFHNNEDLGCQTSLIEERMRADQH